MEFLDARRLTGPSLLADVPGTILDIACNRDEAEQFVPVWRGHVERMLGDLGWSGNEFSHVILAGGVSLFFSAPLDALYAATEINEWAWAACDAELHSAAAPDYDARLAEIRTAIADEANPALLRLEAAASHNATPFLWDDDEASVGLGRYASTWPVRELPDTATIDWSAHRDIPVGIVTGTNGKTTTVRLATHILRRTNKNVGLCSTDWIAVNDRIVDRGDWSGPGGARTVLRQPDVDVAILESARGGLLRRGLGVNSASAALITNIAEDHLGDFGSQNLGELLNIKWIISRPVVDRGRLILNADDELLVAKAVQYRGEVVWFSLQAENKVVRRHVSNGGTAFLLDDDQLLSIKGDQRDPICAASDIPITLNAAARHNIANALAAAALTNCLGVGIAEIRDGLVSMSQDDNPGRCNVYDIDGRKVLVDFAHNPHAMQALFTMAQALPAQRRVLCFGQAGDRPDHAIRELARDAWAIGLDRVIVSELATYHRGRESGEVFAIIRDELLAAGATADQIEHHDEETESLEAAIAWSSPGDLVIMLALGSGAEIRAQLTSLSTS